MNKSYTYDAAAEATRAGEPRARYFGRVHYPERQVADFNRLEVFTDATSAFIEFYNVEAYQLEVTEPIRLRVALPVARALADLIQAALDGQGRRREAGKKAAYTRKARSAGGGGETPNPAADALPGGPEAR